MPARPAPPPRRTLAVERTVLAWDRTALAVLGNGSLLLVRHLRGSSSSALLPAELGVAALALVVMLVIALLGRRRARRLHDPALRAAAAPEPLVAGAGVLLVGIGVLLVLVLGAPER